MSCHVQQVTDVQVTFENDIPKGQKFGLGRHIRTVMMMEKENTLKYKMRSYLKPRFSFLYAISQVNTFYRYN